MSSPTCGQIRSYLAAVHVGGAGTPPSGVWEALAAHGAVTGSPSAPSVTPVGEHVLAELQVRAYRADSLSLDRVAGDLGRVLQEYEDVAKHAEYFLSDLGPVVPALALPLLRPVSMGLANRRGTPAELAEEFRNVWGGVEVMGGDPRDRLLAAELINASSNDMSHLYSPIMNTTERIREKVGAARPSVTPATILQIAAPDEKPASLDGYFAVRATAGSEEAAAMLAAGAKDPAGAIRVRDEVAKALSPGANPSGDALHAATFLVAQGATPAAAPRVLAISKLIGAKVPSPLTCAALLSGHSALSPEEIGNWLDKAIGILTTRQMAPTARETSVLAVALVHGLPEHEYLEPSPTGTRPAPEPASMAALTALHAWIYRPLLGAAEPTPTAAPPA